MQTEQEKEFYIVCDCELSFDSQRGIVVKKPTLLYEDGALKIESIGIFPDRTRGKYRREWYRGIQSYLSDLNNPARDLRHDFSPCNYEPTVLDVLWNNPDKECFSRSELADLISKRNIEAAIYSAIVIQKKKCMYEISFSLLALYHIERSDICECETSQAIA